VSLEQDLATWRTSAHGILYWLERGCADIADYPASNGSGKRKVAHEWELVCTRRIMALEAQAEEFNDNEIREACERTRARMGYPKCEVTLGKGFA
jgi:hypothetical protein